jgi:hypothetical protein
MKKVIQPTPAKKTHSQRGKWVFKPTKSTIVICTCGNKYIVTRKEQTTCIDCIYGRKNH